MNHKGNSEWSAGTTVTTTSKPLGIQGFCIIYVLANLATSSIKCIEVVKLLTSIDGGCRFIDTYIKVRIFA